MNIETNCNVDNRLCFMTTRGLMETLPRTPFTSVVNMTAEPASLPKIMFVANTSSALTCLKDAKNYEARTTTDECSKKTQSNKFNSDPTIKMLDKGRPSAVMSNWIAAGLEAITGSFAEQLARGPNPNRPILCLSEKFISMIIQLECMWNGHPLSIKAMQDQKEAPEDGEPTSSYSPIPCRA